MPGIKSPIRRFKMVGRIGYYQYPILKAYSKFNNSQITERLWLLLLMIIVIVKMNRVDTQ